MKSDFFNWLAIGLILEIGLLHVVTAQGEFQEARYMGYLFVANCFGSILAAVGIYHRQFWGWMLGLVIAAGSMAGFVWSRTLGMPGMNVEEWNSAYGIVAMSLESIFILLVLLRPWKFIPDNTPLYLNSIFYHIPYLTGASIIILSSILTYQWDVSKIKSIGHHVGSLDQVCRTPVTTFAELEDLYGIQISLVATSMMDNIVDVRIKIVDPEKAHAILQNQAALLVNQDALILSPHMHSHNGSRLKAGKIFVMFFPTQQKIHTGSEVSLVFGPVRVESVVVK